MTQHFHPFRVSIQVDRLALGLRSHLEMIDQVLEAGCHRPSIWEQEERELEQEDLIQVIGQLGHVNPLLEVHIDAFVQVDDVLLAEHVLVHAVVSDEPIQFALVDCLVLVEVESGKLRLLSRSH